MDLIDWETLKYDGEQNSMSWGYSRQYKSINRLRAALHSGRTNLNRYNWHKLHLTLRIINTHAQLSEYVHEDEDQRCSSLHV